MRGLENLMPQGAGFPVPGAADDEAGFDPFADDSESNDPFGGDPFGSP
jgi:hypothetical protein